MRREQDELVEAGHRGALDDVFHHGDVGFIPQRNIARHAPVVIGVRAVHGARQDHHARLLGDQLRHADGVERIVSVGAMGSVLLDSAQWQDGDVVLFGMLHDLIGRHLVPPIGFSFF
ncbi:MAG: hypothetical protein MAG451_03260 [Anaerolineales bacterium]|nr:hypothetical protein [Anaerolineales bacterium]